jgi:hypothetical protein
MAEFTGKDDVLASSAEGLAEEDFGRAAFAAAANWKLSPEDYAEVDKITLA